VKTKTSVGLVVLALLLVGSIAAWWFGRGDRVPPPAVATKSAPQAKAPAQAAKPSRARASVEASDTGSGVETGVDSGVIDGRVLHGLTHEGVPDAELTFLGEGGVSTFRTSSDGTFQLTPAGTGTFVLATITAPGFLPYAPELGHSSVRVTLARGQAVHGITLLLYPAVDHQGLVIDARGAPIAGAHVRLLGSPAGEQVLEGPAAEWRTGRDGRFTFQAADDSVLEASSGNTRGWAHVDRDVAIGKQLTIQLEHAAPRDATITGVVRNTSGAPIAGALVRASPSIYAATVPTVFATSGPDGAFTLAGLDRAAYDLSAEAEDHVRGVRANIRGGSRNVELTLDAGLPLAGQVVDRSGAPVPVFTLLVRRRARAARPLVATRSLIDPQGRFSVRVPPGDYDLLASAPGSARGTPAKAAAGMTDVRIVLGRGATLRGKVISSDDHAPIGNAFIACETQGGGASALPADAGTVTRPDGTFELTGISAGPLAIRIRAVGYHAKIEAGTASDGAALGPITIELTRIGGDEASATELVGIGIGLFPDGDALRVIRVVPGSGAFDAGIGFDDRVIAVDGVPVAPLGLEGTIARIRGIAGTTVTLTLWRDGQDIQLIVERRMLRA
jgi:hypothetical protein